MEKIIHFFLLLLLLSFSSFGKDIEREKAQYYLSMARDEVYLSFPLPSSQEIQNLNRSISIDKIENDRVYAYLSSENFDIFLDRGYPFTVLEHPGDYLKNPKMSDFSDSNNRQWDRYPTYQGYLNLMEQFEQQYPQLCKVEEIGQSIDGRKLLVAKLSDNVSKDEDEPKYFLSCTIHGDEIAGFVLSLRLMDYLLSNYGKDARVDQLISNGEIWIAPAMNPDGTYFGGDNTVFGSRRSNKTGQDLNRDFPDPIEGMKPNGVWQKETEAWVNFEKKYDFVMSADVHGGIELVCYPWGCDWTKRAADEKWWELVSRQYADVAQANSPSGYFTGMNNGIINGTDWYPITGGRNGWHLYYRHSRQLTLEISNRKQLEENKLEAHWQYNRDPMLNHMREMFNGIRGKVIDSNLKKGLKAKVFVENHDKDSSFVYSNDPHGDYYRPIFKGTYDVTFSVDGYEPITKKGIVVENGKATIVDVDFASTKISHLQHEIKHTTHSINNNVLYLNTPSPLQKVSLTSANGKVLFTKNMYKPQSNRGEIPLKNISLAKGMYILDISTKTHRYTKRFIYQ